MMKRRAFVSGIVLVLAVGGAAVCRAESRAVQSSPSDGGELRLRVAAYWRLLAAGDRAGAAGFLRPEGPAVFSGAPGASIPGSGSEGDRALGGWDPGPSRGSASTCLHRPDRFDGRSGRLGPALPENGWPSRDGARATPSGRIPRPQKPRRPPMRGAVPEAGPSKRRLRE